MSGCEYLPKVERNDYPDLESDEVSVETKWQRANWDWKSSCRDGCCGLHHLGRVKKLPKDMGGLIKAMPTSINLS
jgi:hypothetical protein